MFSCSESPKRSILPQFGSRIIVVGAILFSIPSCISLSTHKNRIQAAEEKAYEKGYEKGFSDCDEECLKLQRRIGEYFRGLNRDGEEAVPEKITGDEPWQK